MGIKLAVCFDGSQESLHALEYALATGHRLTTLVSVVKASKNAEKEGKRASEMEAKAEASVADALERLGLPQEVPEIVVLRSRDARAQLVEHIEGADYDLCVVGNRGLGAIKRAFLGSTSQTLLNGLQKPVCVVRSGDGVSEKGARKYLLAVDGSEPSTRAAQLLRRLLQPEDTVHILGLYDTSLSLAAGAYVDVASALLVVKELTRAKREAAQDAVQEACGALPPGAKDRITTAVRECSHVGQGLLEYAASEGIGTIVMGSRGRGAVSRAFLGSAANHVLHESHLPLIVSH